MESKIKMRVVNTVSCCDESGKRVVIMSGECAIEVTHDNIYIHWKDQYGNTHRGILTNVDYAQYLNVKHLIPI